MIEKEIGLIILTLGVFIVAVHALGYIFERMRQPRLVGEILAGILLGPFVLGSIFPDASNFIFNNSAISKNGMPTVLSFIYWLGVLFLMFLSGSQVRRLLAKEQRRETAWILGVGTPLPFLLVMGLGLAAVIPLDTITGSKGVQSAALLVLASAVAVTSIPVISRIFQDLRIMHTRFVSLILGSAVLEDIALWGVLGVATAMTKTSSLSEQGIIGESAEHIIITIVYMVIALFLAPRVLRRLRGIRLNLLFRTSPIAYILCVLFAYISIASLLGVNLVFAAFLAGFGLVGGIKGGEREHYEEALDTVSKFSFATFIPIYFGLIGYKLVFGREFSLAMLLIFLVGSSLIALISVGFAARLAGFRKLDILNLAITTNARGGPGIVLASVAYDAGIINAAFYTTLVLTAVFTSQAAGAWLRYVLNKGWPLLSSNPEETWEKPAVPSSQSAKEFAIRK